MNNKNLSVEYLLVNDLIPYVNNSRTHSEEQINQICSSIKEFGFTNPLLIDDDGGIIAGHGRLLAAKKLGLKEVPTITLTGLTEAQKKAYVIADNQLALNAGWNEELLKIEIENLIELDFDVELLGFDDLDVILGKEDNEELEQDSKYTRKIETPIYDIKGKKPDISDLYKNDKTKELIKSIEKSSCSEEVKSFLIAAAMRHTVFDYENIAEYYAQADQEVRKLMEDSALVIIDYDAAIEKGYIELTEKLKELSENE